MEPYAEAIVTALRTAWAGYESVSDNFFSYWRIAGSVEDQESATDNPLWEIVRWMPARKDYYEQGSLEPYMMTHGIEGFPVVERYALMKRYSYALPTPGDLEWFTKILDGRGVVESGAGSGYWAWQLEQTGIDVAAYDPYAAGEDNTYCHYGPYATVLRQDATAVKHHADRALFLCWPQDGEPDAAHALANYDGDLLIYAGESWGGCTGDEDFFEALHKEWRQVASSGHHVTWWGIHCDLTAYTRR